jgi:hypothetical protein
MKRSFSYIDHEVILPVVEGPLTERELRLTKRANQLTPVIINDISTIAMVDTEANPSFISQQSVININYLLQKIRQAYKYL